MGIDLLRGLVAPFACEIAYVASRAEFSGFGGRIRFRSGDAPDRLRGVGADLCVMDESGYCSPELWPIIRPALADHSGRLLLIGTPNGSNWATDMERNPDTAVFHFGSAGNPFLAPQEIIDMRRDLPAKFASQELDGEIIDMSGGIFPNLSYIDSQETPIVGHTYVAGCDIGGAGEDWSVFAVGDITDHSIPHYERFHGNHPEVVSRLQALITHWKPLTTAIEVNGIGRAVYDSLAELGLDVVPWTTTNASKSTLVNKWLSNPPLVVRDDDLRGEFNRFEAKRLPSGAYQLGASSGHDDIVMSCLIAGWAMDSTSMDFTARMS